MLGAPDGAFESSTTDTEIIYYRIGGVAGLVLFPVFFLWVCYVIITGKVLSEKTAIVQFVPRKSLEEARDTIYEARDKANSYRKGAMRMLGFGGGSKTTSYV